MATAIRKVTDLRTGLPHMVRDSKGRFISRKRAARYAHKDSELMDSFSPLVQRAYVRHVVYKRAQ